VPAAYDLNWDEAAKAELAELGSFERKIVVDSVERQLRHQPDVETRNRKPLREPLDELPDASWELRVREYRVLYWITDRRRVTVLRVILKGGATLNEVVGRGRQP
jgi:mRNA-degrading endonuclease RelE of RelBE toxin-antitoxin system